MLPRNRVFNRDIIIADKRFRFYLEPNVSDKECVIHITKYGYNIHIVKDAGQTVIEGYKKLSLDKLNNHLPDDMQLSKDQIIYILTSDLDE